VRLKRPCRRRQHRLKLPTPLPEERAALALRRELHTLIREQLCEESERGKGRLSVLFPEMTEVYSSAAETDAESLRGWIKSLKEKPNLLKPLIREYRLKRSLSAAFFHNRAGNNGWHRSLSHARGCCCWMSRFWGAIILLSGTLEGTAAFLQLSEVGAASIIAQ